jgi:hypothetical protein
MSEIREELLKSMKAVEDKTEEAEVAETEVNDPAEEVVETKSRDESGKFAKKETAEEPTEEPTKEPTLSAPQSWSGPMKERWKELAPDFQAEILRRENDTHKMVTSHDGELRLGREMKDVISPYMPIIQAEGGNPAQAVQGLLNTAYLLRTGTPERKVQLLQEIARTYDIPMGGVQQQSPNDYVQRLESKIQQLEQQVNPETVKSLLQGEMENVRIQSEINAFAANTANKHFESVKAAMAPLLASGQAKDLQEAYDMACWASPSIRSTMLNSYKENDAAKRKEEMAAKKNASVSITGSPSLNSGNAKPPPERSIREELQANMAAVSGSKI